jgi:hypothetical protein
VKLNNIPLYTSEQDSKIGNWKVTIVVEFNVRYLSRRGEEEEGEEGERDAGLLSRGVNEFGMY